MLSAGNVGREEHMWLPNYLAERMVPVKKLLALLVIGACLGLTIGCTKPTTTKKNKPAEPTKEEKERKEKEEKEAKAKKEKEEKEAKAKKEKEEKEAQAKKDKQDKQDNEEDE
jgi:hypothetical protein